MEKVTKYRTAVLRRSGCLDRRPVTIKTFNCISAPVDASPAPVDYPMPVWASAKIGNFTYWWSCIKVQGNKPATGLVVML